MKKRSLIFLLIIFSLLPGQSVLLFDGGGQMGIYSKDGIVSWNSDLFSGPVLLDGTFNYFPQKYGLYFSQSLQSDPFEAFTTLSTRDTARFSTTMDYQMGDYNLDQLDLEGKYTLGNSYLKFSGFKRSFSGNGFPAQFIRQDGREIPIQQGYRSEYGIKTPAKSVMAAVLLLNSDHNFIGGDFNSYGKIENRITAGGVAISQKLKRSTLKIGISQFHQVYDPSMPFFPERTKVRLSRQFSLLGIDSLKAGPVHLFSEIKVQSQGARQMGQNSNIRDWAIISGGIKKGVLQASVGGNAHSNIISPEARIILNSQGEKLSASADLNIFSKPAHAMISSQTDWENWQTASANLAFSPGIFKLGGRVNYVNATDLMIFDHDSSNWTPVSIDESALSTSVYGSVSLFNKFHISVAWDHVDNMSLLSDGIGNRISTDISFSQEIRILAVTLKGNLHWEEYFNRNFSIGFDPHWGIPYMNGPLPAYNTSTNNLSGRISVEISSMTIYGMMYNIPNYLGNNFSIVDINSTWTQNNAYIPPMGKMAVIGINWRFLN